jgi:hypothetical protein
MTSSTCCKFKPKNSSHIQILMTGLLEAICCGGDNQPARISVLFEPSAFAKSIAQSEILLTNINAAPKGN